MFSQDALVPEIVKLRRFAFRLTHNNDDADDLVQSTCLRALEKADLFEDGTNLFGWMSKIMFNQFVSGYRRRVKYESQSDPEFYIERASVAASQDVDADLALVKKAMMKLTAEQREIIVMICVQGMRYDEVSFMLKIPVGTVRSRLSRARKQLNFLISGRPVNANTARNAPFSVSGSERLSGRI